MEGISISAAITTLVSIAIIGSILLWKSSGKETVFLVLGFLLLIPMSPLTFYFIRLPLDGTMQAVFGRTSETYHFITTLYAPLTEEPAKLWALLIPWFLANLNEDNTVRFGVALGLGFGVGEIWLLATELAKNPAIAALPWYALGGFLNERFMVCVMHGAWTTLALRRLRVNFMAGLLGAMGLHYLANFPIYLAAINLGGLGKSIWYIILAIWVPLYFLGMVALLIYFIYGRLNLQNINLFINGRATCPECGAVYVRPWFGVNGLTKRYERCPSCKSWRWVGIWRKEK